MSRIRERFAVRALFAAVALLVIASAVLAAARRIDAYEFKSNGAAVSGWYWIRQPVHHATWSFRMLKTPARTGTLHFNADFLVTNGTSGGSGYGAAVMLHFKNDLGKTADALIDLGNHFRPQDLQNSNGVGYQAHGAVAVPSTVAAQAGEIYVTFSYADIKTLGRHVAANERAGFLAGSY
jgi:hypothetical protein